MISIGLAFLMPSVWEVRFSDLSIFESVESVLLKMVLILFNWMEVKTINDNPSFLTLNFIIT